MANTKEIPTTGDIGKLVADMETFTNANLLIVNNLNKFAKSTEKFAKLKIDKSITDNIKILSNSVKGFEEIGNVLKDMSDDIIALVGKLDTEKLLESINLLCGSTETLTTSIDFDNIKDEDKLNLAKKLETMNKEKKAGFFDLISTLLDIIGTMSNIKAPNMLKLHFELSKSFASLDKIVKMIQEQSKKISSSGLNLEEFGKTFVLFEKFVQSLSFLTHNIAIAAQEMSKNKQAIDGYTETATLVIGRFIGLLVMIREAKINKKAIKEVKTFNELVVGFAVSIENLSKASAFIEGIYKQVNSGLEKLYMVVGKTIELFKKINEFSKDLESTKESVKLFAEVSKALKEIAASLGWFGLIMTLAAPLILIGIKVLEISMKLLGKALENMPPAEKFTQLEPISKSVSALTSISANLAVLGLVTCAFALTTVLGLLVFWGEMVLLRYVVVTISDPKFIGAINSVGPATEQIVKMTKGLKDVAIALALLGVISILSIGIAQLGLIIFILNAKLIAKVAEIISNIKITNEQIDSIKRIVDFIYMCGGIIAVSALVGLLVILAWKYVLVGFLSIFAVAGMTILLAIFVAKIQPSVKEGAEALYKIGLFYLLIGAVILVMYLVGIAILYATKPILIGLLALVGLLIITVLFAFAVQKIFKNTLKGLSEFGILMLCLAGTVVILLLGSMLWQYVDFAGLMVEIGLLGLLLGAVIILCKYVDKEFQLSWKGALAILILLGGMCVISILTILAANMAGEVAWPPLIAMWINMAVMLAALIIVCKLVQKDKKSMLIGLGILVAIGGTMIIVGIGLQKLVQAMTPEPDWEVFAKIFVAIIAFLAMAIGLGVAISTNPIGMALAGAVVVACGVLAVVGGAMAVIGEGLKKVGEAAPYVDTAVDAIPKLFSIVGAVADNCPGPMVMLKAMGAAMALSALTRPVIQLADLIKDLALFRVPEEWDEKGNPISYRHLDTGDIDLANYTVTTLISGFIGIFTPENMVCLKNLDKVSIWTIAKLSMVMGLAEDVGVLLDVVQKMAGMLVPDLSEGVDPKTGKPTKWRKLNWVDFLNASVSLSIIINGFTNAIVKAIDSSNIWFIREETLEKMQMVFSLVDPVSKLLDMVKQLAEGKIQKLDENGKPIENEYLLLTDWIQKLEENNPIKILVDALVKTITGVSWDKIKMIEGREDGFKALGEEMKQMQAIANTAAAMAKVFEGDLKPALSKLDAEGNDLKETALETNLNGLLASIYNPIAVLFKEDSEGFWGSYSSAAEMVEDSEDYLKILQDEAKILQKISEHGSAMASTLITYTTAEQMLQALNPAKRVTKWTVGDSLSDLLDSICEPLNGLEVESKKVELALIESHAESLLTIAEIVLDIVMVVAQIPLTRNITRLFHFIEVIRTNLNEFSSKELEVNNMKLNTVVNSTEKLILIAGELQALVLVSKGLPTGNAVFTNLSTSITSVLSLTRNNIVTKEDINNMNNASTLMGKGVIMVGKLFVISQYNPKDPTMSSVKKSINGVIESLDIITPERLVQMDKQVITLGMYVKALKDLSKVHISPTIPENVSRTSNATIRLLDKVNTIDRSKLNKMADISKNMATFATKINGDFNGLARAMNENIITALNKVQRALDELQDVMEELPDKVKSAIPTSITVNGTGGEDGNKDDAVNFNGDKTKPNNAPNLGGFKKPAGKSEATQLSDCLDRASFALRVKMI